MTNSQLNDVFSCKIFNLSMGKWCSPPQRQYNFSSNRLMHIICTGQNKKMSATQHALQFAFATVAVHTRCQLEDRLGWLLLVQIHALSFSLWLAQRNCQEEIKWHAVWIEMPYATTQTVVLSYLQTMRVCNRQKDSAYNINSLYISSFDFECVFIFFFNHTSNYS